MAITGEDVDIIVAQVLERIKGDSVRIDDLVRTNELVGEDLLELNGGRCVSLEDLKKFIKGIGIYLEVIGKNDKETIPTDNNVFSALRTLFEISKNEELLKKIFHRKDKTDENPFLQYFKGGIIVGKDGFAEGLTGFGAKIDKDGRAEMRSLTLWESLEVPELRYNSVKVFLGIDWQVPGAGIIESCTPDTDAEGNQLTTGTCTLKLEKGQFGAIDVDDIALGIYHFGNQLDSTEDTDDGKGGFTFAGFATSYFRITELSGTDNKTFKYSLRPGFNVHPQPQMTFACYGNFTKSERQKSTYRTRTYTRRLWKQNTWEIGVQNIAAQNGDLTNLNIFGLKMTGYSAYLNSIYFTGEIMQVKPDGTPVKTANDRGAWQNNTKYDYYDRVSHDGCIWLCVNEDGTDTEPLNTNPSWLKQVDRGMNGQDGTSFRILGSKDDPSQLPQEGNEIGDAYLINGDLWVWSGAEWNNAGNIQGPAGESVQNMGGWYEGMIVPYLGVVRMGDATFMCVNTQGTRNPPYYTLLDNQGNRIKSEQGYILTGEMNNTDYQLIAKDGTDGTDGLDGVPGKDGKDGKTYYTWIRYADDAEGNGISNDPTGKAFIGFAYNKETPLESNNPKDYIWSDIKGEPGVPGEKGADGKQYYTWISYSDNADGNPMYQQPKVTTQYIGIAVNKDTAVESSNPADYTWSKFKGEKGDGYTQIGPWYEGLLVPKLGVVTMGGNSFAAKEATRNPPMFTLLDNQGNRIKSEQGYILTGEINYAEYLVLAMKGEDGKDGAPGKDGTPGEDGKQGIAGCVVRDSEWAIGVEYRNDSNITDGSVEIRYIDVVLVRNDAVETGWDVYRCKITHVSSDSITYENTSYWEKFGVNVGAIFTSLIIAKNAKIQFLQGNELTIAHSVTGKPCLGLSGSAEGEKIRMWCGSELPQNAPYKLLENGDVIQGGGRAIFRANGSGQLGNGGISWDSLGLITINTSFKVPFVPLAGNLISSSPPSYRYDINDSLRGNAERQSFIVTGKIGEYHDVYFPSDPKWSGVEIAIYNSSTEKDNIFIEGSSEPNPDINRPIIRLHGEWRSSILEGTVLKLPSSTCWRLLGIGTKDIFYAWHVVY